MENSQKPNERKDIKQAYRTAYLIAGFLKQTLTIVEKEELDAWILASDENMILFEKMTDETCIQKMGRGMIGAVIKINRLPLLDDVRIEDLLLVMRIKVPIHVPTAAHVGVERVGFALATATALRTVGL